MQELMRSIDPQALKERQEAIFRALMRGGTQEVARHLAVLSLISERLQYDCDVNRHSLELVKVPIASGIMNPDLLAKSVRISADLPFDQSAGLYGLEHNEQGLPFRWTGPGRSFKFETAIDRSGEGQAVLRMVKSGHIDRRYLESMRIFVDGNSVTGKAVLDELPQISFKLPKRDASPATTEIVVECATWSPAEKGLGSDSRQLGVPFLDLSIEPAE